MLMITYVPAWCTYINVFDNVYAAWSTSETAGRHQYCVRNPNAIGIKVLDMGIKDYSGAVAACKSMNMQMAVIRSQEELNAVTGVIGGSTGRVPIRLCQ